MIASTVYLKKSAHGFCFAVLCCGYTLTDFPISIRLTSLALWQSNDCPSASKAALMNMDKYFMWIHYERLHNHNKAKNNKTVCIFLGIYCFCLVMWPSCFTGMYINWFNGSGSGWFFAGIALICLWMDIHVYVCVSMHTLLRELLLDVPCIHLRCCICFISVSMLIIIDFIHPYHTSHPDWFLAINKNYI